MTSSSETPAQKLAALISTRMVKEKLLDSKRADGFLAKLAAGKLKESDWRLEIESAQTGRTPRK